MAWLFTGRIEFGVDPAGVRDRNTRSPNALPPQIMPSFAARVDLESHLHSKPPRTPKWPPHVARQGVSGVCSLRGGLHFSPTSELPNACTAAGGSMTPEHQRLLRRQQWAERVHLGPPQCRCRATCFRNGEKFPPKWRIFISRGGNEALSPTLLLCVMISSGRLCHQNNMIEARATTSAMMERADDLVGRHRSVSCGLSLPTGTEGAKLC
jgi:hypothetical protein